MLSTGGAPLEEYCEDANGELWARFRPEAGGAPAGGRRSQNVWGPFPLRPDALINSGGPAVANRGVYELKVPITVSEEPDDDSDSSDSSP